MALPSITESPSTSEDTPGQAVVPYRLPTAAVALMAPPPVDTATLTAIRARIEPNSGWWQFPLPRIPWQVRLGLGVYSAVVALGVVAIAWAAYLGASR
jgi:hypothetical protein